jgi:YHS domain-containing protein
LQGPVINGALEALTVTTAASTEVLQMKNFVFSFCLIFGLSAFASSQVSLNKAGVAIEGYDPVSYFSEAGPQKGDSKYQSKQSDAIYLFVNQANKDKFEKEPGKYIPQFGGWCAYAVADSKSKVEIDPKSFVIQEGRLLLFYNGIWGDTRKKWLSTKDKSAQEYLKTADANWPETKSKDP